MHRIPNDPGNQGSGWLFRVKALLAGRLAPPPWACFQGQDFLGTRAEGPDGLHPRAQPSTPSWGAHCTQPGLAPGGAPQCLPIEGISAPQTLYRPRTRCPCRFPLEGGTRPCRGAGAGTAGHRGPALQPCPARGPVLSRPVGGCQLPWARRGLGAWGGEQHPLPGFLLGQSPSRPCCVAKLSVRLAFWSRQASS